MKIERILVAVDGSPTSARAVEWTAGLGHMTGAEIIAVHALGLLERDPDGTLVPAQPHRHEIQERFESTWCEPLRTAGVPHRCLFHDGEPVSVILTVSAEEVVDLLVLGSRGLGGYPELLLGSTSTQVAQRSLTPVTIIPPADPVGRTVAPRISGT